MTILNFNYGNYPTPPMAKSTEYRRARRAYAFTWKANLDIKKKTIEASRTFFNSCGEYKQTNCKVVFTLNKNKKVSMKMYISSNFSLSLENLNEIQLLFNEAEAILNAENNGTM